MRRLGKFPILALLCVLLLVLGEREGWAPQSAPSRVTDLDVVAAGPDSLTLAWTAPTVTIVGPGGSGTTRAARYDIRYSTENPGTDLPAWWGIATEAQGEPTPAAPGTAQPPWTLPNLTPDTTYYIALKSFNGLGVASEISNIAFGTTTTVSDTTPPAAVTDLLAGNPTSSSIDLTWTAPGDDDMTGTASEYDIAYRRATDGPVTDENWNDALTLHLGPPAVPAPQEPGSSELFRVTGLLPETGYYFAIKTADEVPNWSGISNIAAAQTQVPDTTAPAAVTDLAAGGVTANSVRLTWPAPGDDGNTGTATSYDIRYSTSVITNTNWGSAIQAIGEPTPQLATTPESFRVTGLQPNTTYFFALKTADEVLLWSALSNVASGTTTAGGGLADAPWPMSAHDLRHTSQSHLLGPQTADLDWSLELMPEQPGSEALDDVRPVVAADGSIYVSVAEYLFRIDRSGFVRSQTPVSWATTAWTPAVGADGTVFVGTLDRLVAVGQDGTRRWELVVGAGQDVDSGAVAIGEDDAVYWVAADARLHAVAPGGEELWSYDVGPLRWGSAPAIGGDGTIYVPGFYNDRTVVYAFSPEGQVLWRWDSPYFGGTRTSWQSHPVVSSQGVIYTGGEVWETQERFYGYCIFAINPDGTTRWEWRTTTGGITTQMGLDAQDVLYVGGGNDDMPPYGRLLAISPEGSEVWEFELDEAPWGTPVVGADGTVYFLASGVVGGVVYAVAPGGTEWWRLLLGETITVGQRLPSPAIGLDGSLYFGGVRVTNGYTDGRVDAIQPDTLPPAAVDDLAAASWTADSVALTWTAPGDSGNVGTAASYDIRYSTSAITDANWAFATQVTGEPAPQRAGTSESFTVPGLAEQTIYYFALKTADEVPNWSELSNVASGTTLPDTTAPSQITDLAVASPTGSSVTLTWTAVGDDGDLGNAAGYDVRYSTAAITDANWATASQATGEPTPAAPGTSETFVVSGLVDDTTYYFAVKAFDDAAVPNYSPLSNVESAATLPDTAAPAAVTNLAAGSATGTTIRLTWTAPGDDGNVGTAASYDIRRSTSAITEANWAAATPVSGEPAPQPAGASESFTVTGLSPSTTYYFALKSADEKGNISAISNSPNATTLDTVPPAAIADLAAGNATANSIQLTWTAPGDDGTSGTARTYDVRYSTANITDANWATASQATREPAPQAAGTQESFTVSGLTEGTRYYFAMKTADEVPNTSPLSNVATATTLDVTAPAAITTLAVTGRTLNSVSLSWTAVGEDGTTGAASAYDLRYSTATITAANWDNATQVTGEPTPQAPGSAESFTVTGLLPDTRYYFAIKAVDEVSNAGTLSNVESERTLASLTLPLGSGWTMLGVSMVPTGTDLPTWLGISGLPSNQWRVLRWWPADGAYISEPSTNPILDAVEARGFWLWLASARTAQFQGARVESDSTVTIPLAEGWNQVSTPFEDASIDWSTVKVKTPTQSVAEAVSLEAPAAAALVANYAWAYRDGAYRLVHGTIGEIQQMEPWEGLWILAQQDCDLVVSGQATTAARTEERGRSPEVEWLVRLEATAGQAKDPDNYLGVADRAYQIAGPPPVAGFVDLRFTPTPDTGLAVDLRTEAQASLAWDLEVETDLEDAQVSLSWPDLAQVPRGYRLTLYDLEDGRALQMRTTSGYSYNSGQGGVRHFRIEASRMAAGMLVVANLAVEQTRAGTAITYLLSQDATVTVDIYNLAGVSVRNLAENLPAVAGENSILWDGRDEQGRSVPAGTYLCEVTASSEDGQTAAATRTLVVLR